MSERRSLVQGLKDTPAIDERVVREFVYEGKKQQETLPIVKPSVQAPPTVPVTRVPISTRIRDDYSKALKRASLERQLGGIQPSTLQGILEEAIGPWLKGHGYLP